MNLFKGLFGKKSESRQSFKDGIKIYESETSKDFEHEEDQSVTVEEILKKFDKTSSIIVMETFSKQEKKVIGRRKLLPFEVPLLIKKKYVVKNEIKIRFYFAEQSELTQPSSKISSVKRAKQKQQSLFNPDELVIEREGLVKYHRDLNKNAKEFKLFITKDIIFFHPIKEKSPITQIPLVKIDSVAKHETEPNTFVVSTTGVDYHFFCKNEEAVSIWVKDLVYFIRYAQEKFLVQQAEIKMNESNATVINSLLGLCDLSENEIFAKKKLRETLFKMLEKKLLDENVSFLNSIKRYIKAFEEDDRLIMDEIADNLIGQGLITFEENTEFEFKRRISDIGQDHRTLNASEKEGGSKPVLFRASTAMGFPENKNSYKIKSQVFYKKFYDKIREKLRTMFEIDEFVDFLLSEIYKGATNKISD